MPKATQLERAVADLTAAIVANDDRAGIEAIGAVFMLSIGTLDRIAAALERIADTTEEAQA